MVGRGADGASARCAAGGALIAKRGGGSLPRVMPTQRAATGLDARMIMFGLLLAAPYPLAASLGDPMSSAKDFIRHASLLRRKTLTRAATSSSPCPAAIARWNIPETKSGTSQLISATLACS